MPYGASNVLRKAVEETPVPDVATSIQSIPQSGDEWLPIIAEGNKEMMESVRIIMEQSPVSINRDEIEGVNVYHVTPEDIDPRHNQHLFLPSFTRSLNKYRQTCPGHLRTY